MTRTHSSSPARRTVLDRVFAVGVIIKGIDGAVELIVGFALLLAPNLIDAALDWIQGRARAGTSRADELVATLVGHADAQLAGGGTGFLIAFLIAHGVIKLVLVYALLRRILKAYPWAIGILIAFLAYQVFALVTTPSVAQVLFSALDVVIIVLVWREYRELRRPGDPEGYRVRSTTHSTDTHDDR